jgi:hypothetical protein
MKFLTIYTPAKHNAGPPSPDHMARMGKLMEEETKAGVLVTTGGLLPGAARLSCSGGEITVTDGPFAESKELIAGFAILEAKSKDECLEACRRFLRIAGDGVSEIRQIA